MSAKRQKRQEKLSAVKQRKANFKNYPSVHLKYLKRINDPENSSIKITQSKKEEKKKIEANTKGFRPHQNS